MKAAWSRRSCSLASLTLASPCLDIRSFCRRCWRRGAPV
jgi:hypothetical protein